MPPTERPCFGRSDLFFGPIDGRMEEGRSAREMRCKTLCYTCPERISCLYTAVSTKELYGVWGGMGEGERRRFASFVRNKTQSSITPGSEEFRKLVREFFDIEWEEAM